MKKTVLMILIFVVLIATTGCNVDGKDLLEKDMYSVNENIRIDFNESIFVLSDMVKYINIYKNTESFNVYASDYEKIDSLTLNEGIFEHSFSEPGNYKLVWEPKDEMTSALFIELTIK